MSRAAGRCLSIVCAGLLLAGPSRAGVTQEGDFQIEYAGDSIGPYTNLDTAMMSWMTANTIHDAQLAVRQGGKLIFSHAYTYGAGYKLVTTTNLFRLASISKMLVTAAFSNMLTQGKLTGGEAVFPYLGIHTKLLASQTPDPRVNHIISLELAEHTAGLPGEGAGDPLFEMRDIEVQFGHAPLDETQFAKYLYGQPLATTPGFVANYSNVGYFLLAMVIEKAAGMPYSTYVQSTLLQPMGMTNWALSPSRQDYPNPNEVFADDPYTGPSVFDITANAPQAPFNFEGGDIVWGLTAGPSDWATNAESVSKFIGTYNVYGLGARTIDYARDGCTPGASTWAESETADIDFALLFNKQPCLSFSSDVIVQIRNILSGL